jgi:hypothetical protein
MNITLDDHRCTLVNEILMASSLEGVKNLIIVAMKSLEQNKVHEHAVARFIEKTVRNLEEFSPVNYSMQQWTNIYYSKLEFEKIMDSIKEPKGVH